MSHLNRTLLVLAALLLTLSACTATPTASPTSLPTIALTSTSYPLATPYAQLPAAGICASFDGNMVTVTLNIDVPDPRCTKVRPDQQLTVVNNTQNTLQITLGRFSFSLDAGKSYTIDTPFGDYLEPGVHQLQVSPCCGPELWLEAK